jgi:hypothetical protein
MPERPDELLTELASRGLLRTVDGRPRTTARWQAAMSRAALRLMRLGDPGDDLRLPIAVALLDVYGAGLSEEGLARRVEALLPIEARELDPDATVIGHPGP